MEERKQITDIPDRLVEEVLFFGLMGKILYTQPERHFFQTLLSEGVFEAAPFSTDSEEFAAGFELLQRWSLENAPVLSKEAYEALQVDYTHLFVGVKKVLAPLWESVYFNKERMVFQEQTLQVREWYKKYGLQIEKLNSEPDDHIGLELAFVAYLAQMSLDAYDLKDEEALNSLLQDQAAFIAEHLALWTPAWCELVNEHAQTDFYRGVALVVNAAVRETHARFQALFEKELAA